MRCIVILSTRQLQYLKLNSIANIDEYVKILIISKKEVPVLEKIKEDLKFSFDKVYIVEPRSDGSFLIPYDYDEVAEIIFKLSGKYKITIITEDEGNVLTAGFLRSVFMLPGAKYDELLVFRNKIIMKEELDKHGVRVPKFSPMADKKHLPPEDSFEQLGKLLKLPFIIKPVMSAGSESVYKIDKWLDYENFFKQQQYNMHIFEAEEFIDGTLYHCDLIFSEKEFLFVECCEYTCPNLDLQFGKALGSILLPPDDAIRNDIIDFSKNALRKINAPSGPYHVELFRKGNGEIVFLEAGARSPGLFVNEVYENYIGFNVATKNLALQLGQEIKALSPYKGYSFGCLFPKIKGKVVSLIEPELKSEYKLKWVVKPGDILSGCFSNVDYSGILVAWNRDHNILKSDFEKVQSHKAVIVS